MATHNISIKCGTNPCDTQMGSKGLPEKILRLTNPYLNGAGVKVKNLKMNPRNYYVTFDCVIADSHAHVEGIPSYVQGIVTGILMAQGVEVI
jgi:hypothetical protein